MATKPVFKVVDIPLDATAEQMAELLNGPANEGYALQSLTNSGPGGAARAVFRLPAQRVGGRWVRGEG